MPHEREGPWSDAYVALGSNLGDPQGQLRSACAELAVLTGVRWVAVSRFYRSLPRGGPPEQPAYLNAVVRLATWLTPLDLLRALQAIEQRHGRQRAERWGPRTLDLDLLLHGERVYSSPELTLPHPRMAERAFVLVPLTEVAPKGLAVPGRGVLKDLCAQCLSTGLTPL